MNTINPLRRRTALYAVAAGTAALAGLGTAWWKSENSQAPSNTSPLWAMRFDTPQGDTQIAIESFKGKPLLVNFWATWCPPCIEELPLLDAFYQQNKANGWNVLGLAVDQPSAVRNWLKQRPLQFPVAMAGLAGTDLSKSLGNLNGGLPFTVVFGVSGVLLHKKMGKVEAADLTAWQSFR